MLRVKIPPAGDYWHKRYKDLIERGAYLCGECEARNEQQRQEEKRAAIQQARTERWLEICPPIYCETEVERLPAPARALLPKILEWEPGPRGLILRGPSRSGKTRVAYLLMEQLFMEGERVRIFPPEGFGHECARAFTEFRGEEWIERVRKIPILFFDDLGKLKFTERVESELFGLVEYRTAHHLPLIVTMNFDGNALAAKMSEDRGMPLALRLAEFCDDILFTDAE